jgi:adenylyltransferase/sulfurtransferase
MNLDRYRRQIIVNELGENGQRLLSKKKVVIIGGGGLGSNSANILVRLGVGSIDIIDDDIVDITNLHRMSIYCEEDIGEVKSQILADRLKKINSEVTVGSINKKVTKENIESITKDADIILDGTDNLEIRFLINELAIKKRIPWIYAGVHGTMGMIMAIIPKISPCFKCLSQNIVHKKLSEIPVLGNLPVIIASIQSTEALKVLLDRQLSGLILYDIWKQNFDQIIIKRNQNCICCNKEVFELL